MIDISMEYITYIDTPMYYYKVRMFYTFLWNAIKILIGLVKIGELLGYQFVKYTLLVDIRFFLLL